MMMTYLVIAFCFCMPFLSGCENMDIQIATDAGTDAVKVLTLSDEDVEDIASQSAQYSDKKHTLALPENKYVKQAGVSREIELYKNILDSFNCFFLKSFLALQPCPHFLFCDFRKKLKCNVVHEKE